MPCRSDHNEANSHEIALSRVMCLLGELDDRIWLMSDWDGYHPLAYGCANKTKLDQMTALLCEKLTKMGGQVQNYSLELQIWWRDHQRADAKRKLLEEVQKSIDAEIKVALAKLTPREREILGLTDR